MGFGLRIRSEIAIPGAVPTDEGAPPDLTVSRGVIDAPPFAHGAGPYRLLPRGLLFKAAGVARYAIEPDRIVVEAAAGSDPEGVSALLVATALPAALWLRGAFVAHACAFVPPGWSKAIAVTAPSGGGKSTILHHAVRSGACVVGDDTLSLAPPNAGVVASGLGGGYFLGPMDARVFHRVAGFRLTADLCAIVALVSDDERADLRRIDAQTATATLMQARHRPRVPAILGRNAAVLGQAALLGARLPIYRMGRPRDVRPGEFTAALIAEIAAQIGSDG